MMMMLIMMLYPQTYHVMYTSDCCLLHLSQDKRGRECTVRDSVANTLRLQRLRISTAILQSSSQSESCLWTFTAVIVITITCMFPRYPVSIVKAILSAVIRLLYCYPLALNLLELHEVVKH